jgi:hypothetical protein
MKKMSTYSEGWQQGYLCGNKKALSDNLRGLTYIQYIYIVFIMKYKVQIRL